MWVFSVFFVGNHRVRVEGVTSSMSVWFAMCVLFTCIARITASISCIFLFLFSLRPSHVLSTRVPSIALALITFVVFPLRCLLSFIHAYERALLWRRAVRPSYSRFVFFVFLLCVRTRVLTNSLGWYVGRPTAQHKIMVTRTSHSSSSPFGTLLSFHTSLRRCLPLHDRGAS